MKRLLLLLPLALGCAGVHYETIRNDAHDAEVDGIRYFESAPFLLVHSDGKGNLVSEVLFLPDLTKKRAADPYAWLATNETTLAFSNGVLSHQNTSVDEAVVPKALIEAARAALGAVMAASEAAADAGGTSAIPPPHLYRIVPEGKTLVLIGGPAVDESLVNEAAPIRIVVGGE